MIARIRMMVTLLAALGCLSVLSMGDLAAAPATTKADAARTVALVDSQPLRAAGGTPIRDSATDHARTPGSPIRSSTLPELPGILALATAVTALAGIVNRRKR
jgi:hypothetical protein